ncbi:hypothetical protein SUGI_1050930 [Cryptomeria japonica]|nr:hypothetical protein SUGI_1050930 [Cryptomeria japonica]
MEERDNEIAVSKIVGWYNQYHKFKNLLVFQEYPSLTGNIEEIIRVFDESKDVKPTKSFDRYYIRKRKEEMDIESKSQPKMNGRQNVSSREGIDVCADGEVERLKEFANDIGSKYDELEHCLKDRLDGG